MRSDRDRMRDRWRHMKDRCYDKTYHSYHRYGGRNIKVCDRWLEDFQTFIDDVGYPPFEKAQLDRIDNDGDYSPDNCRWVTAQENCNNRKTYFNKTGYTGVSYKSKIRKYQASFNYKRKHIYVGVYDTPEKAYKERIKAIKKFNKENNENLKFIEFNDLN